MGDRYDLHRALADLASTAVEDETTDAAATITAQVAQHVPGAAGVGISLIAHRGTIQTLGATATFVEAADRFQHELQEGPCVESLRAQEAVHVPDLAADERWPRWAKPVVSELGVRSVLSLQMYVHDHGVGALNLYGTEVDAFTTTDIIEGGLFAAHAAVVIAATQKIDQLERGLGTRTVIGQAEGVLMERYGLDGAQAFSLLARVSQDHNVKLRVVAEEIVRTRRVPGVVDGDATQTQTPERERS